MKGMRGFAVVLAVGGLVAGLAAAPEDADVKAKVKAAKKAAREFENTIEDLEDLSNDAGYIYTNFWLRRLDDMLNEVQNDLDHYGDDPDAPRDLHEDLIDIHGALLNLRTFADADIEKPAERQKIKKPARAGYVRLYDALTTLLGDKYRGKLAPPSPDADER